MDVHGLKNSLTSYYFDSYGNDILWWITVMNAPFMWVDLIKFNANWAMVKLFT